MQFRKFRNEIPFLMTSPPTRKRHFLFPHLDVLAKSSGSETTLYSGYLKDYELSHGDINNLELIYLVDAKRYKQRTLKTELVAIPGDFLILRGAEILNINVQYIYSEKIKTNSQEKETSSQETKAKKTPKKFKVLQFYNGLLIIFIFSLFIPIFIKFDFFSGEFYDTFMSKAWYKKVLLLFATNFGYGFLFPFKKDGDNECFVFRGWKAWITTTIVMLIFFGLFYLWAY